MKYLTGRKIKEDSVYRIFSTRDYGSGAMIVFTGRVRRDKVKGTYVKEIIYEAYKEMAEKEIEKIVELARKKFKVRKIFVKHRTGRVKVGEIAFLVAVLAAHRKEGFSAVQFIIDEVKAKVPIWKKEIMDDGSERWKEEKNV